MDGNGSVEVVEGFVTKWMLARQLCAVWSADDRY